MALCRRSGKDPANSPQLVQEAAGIHVSIAADLEQTARHAASIMEGQYRGWLERDRHSAWSGYKRRYFTVAVGGGNTVKAQYRALLEHHSTAIDWIGHVRFFFLEESTGERGWESPEQGLVLDFLVPLARKLLSSRGSRALARALELQGSAGDEEILQRMLDTMVHPLHMAESRQALDAGNAALASRLARREANRYASEIKQRLGGSMQFHYLLSGIGKDGTLGAFAPYTPELAEQDPDVILLKQDNGALRVALNRGVLTAAECISLIVSGSLKLKALGRFEMDESADFEQTVQETPLRMLREDYDIAQRVYIFADEQALHFEETVFEFRERGLTLQNKAETREGNEPEGVHVFLLHGFMGLFSFTNFLIRLPSAWTVSALHRGSHAKTLPQEQIFPFYARVLRKLILKNWRQGRPVPIAGHSIAGIISDHLLLSLTGGVDAPIQDYTDLSNESRQLVDALRAGGIIHLATWAPPDGPHTGLNIANLRTHRKEGTPLDYSGYSRVYDRAPDGSLLLTEEAQVSADQGLTNLGRFLRLPIAAPVVNSLNASIRSLLNNRRVQQRMLNSDIPYVMRLVGGRLLKTVSFFGLCKEVHAAMHDPIEYQRRHERALEIMLAYDIPFLSMIHEDDFLVSAQRHQEEHEYLLERRLEKEGVKREQDLKVPVRFVVIQREQEELPADPLNPHLLVMATNNEGNSMARQITSAMTRFVNENVAAAIDRGDVEPLASVSKWQREQRPRRRRRVA